MIKKRNIKNYQGVSLNREEDCIFIPPDVLLQPYISCYTITFPESMSDEYTILPSASSTIVISVCNHRIISSLRGVNTKICNVGKYANRMDFLLLIEFHSGCLFPFIKVNQSDFADISFELGGIDKSLTQSIENVVVESPCINVLVTALNKLFLSRLDDFYTGKTVTAIKNKIIAENGNISIRELSSLFFYSEKHIRHLFLQYVGTSPKVFSRIVRVNYALELLQSKNMPLTQVSEEAGFFDQPHFIHDFKSICGLTPQEYMRNISVFYNDNYKFQV